MKRAVFFAFFTVIFMLNGHAQDKIHSAEEINWCGLDFSHCRLLTDFGFTDPDKVCDYYMKTAWNGLLRMESDKFNVPHYFKKEVNFHFDIVKENNSSIDPEGIITYDSYKIDEEKVQEIVRSYGEIDDEGVGLVFIVESLSKVDERASIWVTFFDCKTKDVIQTKKHYGSPGGMGFRNYWGNAFHKVMRKGPFIMRKVKKENL
jgi:hypothetical protein